jgi:hypothetical protein
MSHLKTKSYTIEEIKELSTTTIIGLIKTTDDLELKKLLEEEYNKRNNSL